MQVKYVKIYVLFQKKMKAYKRKAEKEAIEVENMTQVCHGSKICHFIYKFYHLPLGYIFSIFICIII